MYIKLQKHIKNFQNIQSLSLSIFLNTYIKFYCANLKVLLSIASFGKQILTKDEITTVDTFMMHLLAITLIHELI